MQLHAYYCLFQYLQWLPITFLIKYKLLTLAFKAPQPTLPVWCSTISLVKSCFSQTGATYCSLRVTTHSYLSAFAHAIPAALTSQPVETFFNFPSSLKVQSWNLTKLCNANGTLVSSFYCGYSSIYLMPISYPHPNPPDRPDAIPLSAWPCDSHCTMAFALAGSHPWCSAHSRYILLSLFGTIHVIN